MYSYWSIFEVTEHVAKNPHKNLIAYTGTYQSSLHDGFEAGNNAQPTPVPSNQTLLSLTRATMQ
jgi:hypothetical protein